MVEANGQEDSADHGNEADDRQKIANEAEALAASGLRLVVNLSAPVVGHRSWFSHVPSLSVGLERGLRVHRVGSGELLFPRPVVFYELLEFVIFENDGIADFPIDH